MKKDYVSILPTGKMGKSIKHNTGKQMPLLLKSDVGKFTQELRERNKNTHTLQWRNRS